MNSAITKKGYFLLARVFKAFAVEYADNRKLNALAFLSSVATVLAHELKQDNDKFDYDRFFKACGLNN